MRKEYSTEELLPLSGIQHFQFCRRQWALIHVENQWQDNALTIEGKYVHDRVDDPFFTETRKEMIITRSMPVSSYRLGLVGVCDIVEFTRSRDGIHLPGKEGFYLPTPVEYKHGKLKYDQCDEVQLCAQALCLEEMLSIHISNGSLYYHEVRRRYEVELSVELRNRVEEIAIEMHSYFERGYTPQVKTSKACKSCSLEDICLPALQKEELSALAYIQAHIDDEA